MKLKLVQASQGLQWVKQGLLALRKQPMGYMGLLGLTGMLALMLMALTGAAGPLLVVSLMPIAWTAFMVATRRVVTGQRVSLGVFAEIFQSPPTIRRDLLLLGMAYAVATTGVIALASLLGPHADEVAQITQDAEDMAEVLANPMVQQDMLLRLALTLPVSLVFWHAPGLILWGRVPLAKALFFSAVASWRNLGAFVLYGLGWGALMIAFAVVARLIGTVLPVQALMDGVAMIGGMALASAFYASLYFTVVDCFDGSSAASGQAPELDGPELNDTERRDPPDQA